MFRHFNPLGYHIQRRDARDARVFNRESGGAVCEIDCFAWITILVQIEEEGGGEDISRARGVYFGDEICGKVLSETTLEERRAVSSIGGHEQGYMHAPTRQHSIGFFTVAIGEGEEVVVAENEYIEMR